MKQVNIKKETKVSKVKKKQTYWTPKEINSFTVGTIRKSFM